MNMVQICVEYMGTQRFVCPYCVSMDIKMFTKIEHLERHIAGKHKTFDGRIFTKKFNNIFFFSQEEVDSINTEIHRIKTV